MEKTSGPKEKSNMIPKYDIKQVIKHIYNKSILNDFMALIEQEGPHAVFYDKDETKYITLEHFTIEAKMHLKHLNIIKKNYDLDTHEAFIDTLIREARLNLHEYFLNYLDKEAKVLELPFYKIGCVDKIIKFFGRNPRRSLSKKPNELERKQAINTAIYFEGILLDLYKNVYDIFEDDSCYIMVSPSIGQFIGNHLDNFERCPSKNSYGIHLFGSIPSSHSSSDISYSFTPPIYVYINPFSENTLYFGTIKKSKTRGLMLFYHPAEDALTEHQSPIGHSSQVYRLNLYHIFDKIKEHKFKKIVFDL